MQHKTDKTLQIRKILAETCRELRSNIGVSCNRIEDEYDFSKGALNRIENCIVDCKFITVWKISEAMGLKLSDFVKILEEKLGDDFKIIEE